MIKVVIFDFDGVIVESIDIKTEAFRQLFKGYPKHVDAILQYHRDNGGISRQEKIKYFYKNILKLSLTDDLLNELCDGFSKLVVDEVVAAPFVKGAKELLEQLKGKYKVFVISGTPQDEMREIVQRRQLQSYFDGVFGSPDQKADITKRILKRAAIQPSEAVFVGDAVNDLNAAKANNVKFIARAMEYNKFWRNDSAVTAQFPDMQGVLKFIESLNSKQGIRV
jgi:HAD superfamily hydrolase (TIGR01549 family)